MNKPKLENLKFEGAENIPLEKIPCPLCGGSDFEVLVIEQTFPVVRCRSCHLTFANPRPDTRGLHKFYDNYFPPESESLWQEQMSRVFLIEGARKIEELQKEGKIKLPKNPKLLDVGCGMGFFLELMAKEGWQVQGVEPAPDAVRHGRDKLKLEIFEGKLSEAPFKGPYDAVTLWYVMEHVPNPHEILQKVSGLLRPGGLLIIRVPNQNAPIDAWLSRLGLGQFFLMNPPRHLFDYSPKTLTALVQKYGLRMMEIRNGIPRSTGTVLELLRRRVWYSFFQFLYQITGGRIIRGSSITAYAIKL